MNTLIIGSQDVNLINNFLNQYNDRIFHINNVDVELRDILSQIIIIEEYSKYIKFIAAKHYPSYGGTTWVIQRYSFMLTQKGRPDLYSEFGFLIDENEMPINTESPLQLLKKYARDAYNVEIAEHYIDIISI